MGAYEGPKQGFLLSTESVIVPEGGTTAFTVALAIDPLGTIAVTVAVKSGDPDITIYDGALLIFDSSNYAVPHVVTVAAAEDLDSITGSALALVSSPGLVTFGVTAIEGDNEPYPNTVVVDARAPGANNGSSWLDAFTDLHDALSFAAIHPEIVEIRVAQGIYRPAEPNGDRTATFQLLNGVVIKGGYVGLGAPDPDIRAIELYKTILCGDLNDDDADVNPNHLMTEPRRIENTYHVVTGGGTDETAVLDGFIVTGGNANGPGWPNEPYSDSGGGMYCNSISTMSNCTFIANSASWGGGGMYCGPNGGVSGTGPTLTNCRFIGNVAGNGGGMSASDINPTLIDCKFSNNLAINNGGGQDYGDCMPTLINCLFTGNSAYEDGGGMYCQFTYSMSLTNCTFSGNSSGNHGGGICDYYGLPALTNCILRGNRDNRGEDESAQIETWIPPVVNYSCIQGWTGVLGGTGNIGDDPCFADPGYWDPNGTPEDANDDFWVDGDHHLKSQAGRFDPGSGTWVIDDVTSPCIDAGDPMSPIGLEPFPNGGVVNMGAYGGTAEASKSYFGKPVCETIVAGDINGDCAVDFKDFVLMALHWLGGG